MSSVSCLPRLAGGLAALLAIAASAATAVAQPSEPVKHRVEIRDGGFNGMPDFRLEVEQGQVVELTFVFAQTRSLDDQHIIVLKGYGLETELVDYDRREATLRFLANRPGTFELLCELDCEIHRRLQGAHLVVQRRAIVPAEDVTHEPLSPAPIEQAAGAALVPTEDVTREPLSPAPIEQAAGASLVPVSNEETSDAALTAVVPDEDATDASVGLPVPSERATREVLMPTTLSVQPSAWEISEGPVALAATLTDANGTAVRRAPLRFFVEVDFGGIRGPMEIASARTDGQGAALVTYRPTIEGPQVLTARFEGMGLYGESEQSLRLEVRTAVPAYRVPARGMEPVGEQLPTVIGAVLVGIWSTFGYVLYQIFRIKQAGGKPTAARDLSALGG